jgi:pyridoxamine 5'-phosphate oxidase
LIELINIEQTEPYLTFEKYINEAKKIGIKNYDAVCISTYSKIKNEISSRYVNLKYIKGNQWYFFSNYNSDKAKDIDENNQISALTFWPEIFTQVRIKAKIFKASKMDSDLHFQKRSLEKNALSISSNQSNTINNFKEIKDNYEKILIYLREKDTQKRPEYWGGYYFVPYYFEFWVGDKNRLNKRKVFTYIENKWEVSYLEP